MKTTEKGQKMGIRASPARNYLVERPICQVQEEEVGGMKSVCKFE